MVAVGTHDEVSDHASDRRSPATVQVDRFIAGIVGAGRLPAHALDRYRSRRFCMGWRVPVVFSDGTRHELHVLADKGFPYTPVRIAVADPPDVLAWPHLEAEGFLCILPTDASVSGEDPAGVVKYFLGQACSLIDDSIHGRNIEDFRREFLSYWDLSADTGARKYVSLLEPSGPSRHVFIWRGQGKRIIGESQEVMRRWLERQGAGKNKVQDYEFHESVLIWLPEPLVPAEYPTTTADVRALLARNRSPESEKALEDLAASEPDEIDVFLGAPTPNGACFAAVTVRPPRGTGAWNRGINQRTKGFRPGRMPRKLLIERYLSGATKVVKASVKRADHLWIHGRDQDPQQVRLRKTCVAILGCGSVGASLARLLAKAGIGNLLLVDPGVMDWPNTGRHELGAQSVGRPKAPELAREIEKAYPHLCSVTWRRVRVGSDGHDHFTDELARCSLVVSTMGNWAAESYLNDLQQRADDFPPVLYGWLEPNAAAAHALLIPRGAACLRCGMTDKGRPHIVVTDWPAGGDGLQIPACGALFTPYGPAELCWAHALLSETAVDVLIDPPSTSRHRIWIGFRRRIELQGGTWAASWVEEMGDPGIGGLTMEREWPASGSCPVCARRAYAM